MLITIVLVAALLMLTSIYCLINSTAMLITGVAPNNWKKLFYFSLCTGLLLGLASWLATFWMLLPYENIAGEGWFAGLPFMAVYIDASDYHYQFNFTRASVVANGLFWFLLPAIFLHLYGRRWQAAQLRAVAQARAKAEAETDTEAD